MTGVDLAILLAAVSFSCDFCVITLEVFIFGVAQAVFLSSSSKDLPELLEEVKYSQYKDFLLSAWTSHIVSWRQEKKSMALFSSYISLSLASSILVNPPDRGRSSFPRVWCEG